MSQGPRLHGPSSSPWLAWGKVPLPLHFCGSRILRLANNSALLHAPELLTLPGICVILWLQRGGSALSWKRTGFSWSFLKGNWWLPSQLVEGGCHQSYQGYCNCCFHKCIYVPLMVVHLFCLEVLWNGVYSRDQSLGWADHRCSSGLCGKCAALFPAQGAYWQLWGLGCHQRKSRYGLPEENPAQTVPLLDSKPQSPSPLSIHPINLKSLKGFPFCDWPGMSVRNFWHVTGPMVRNAHQPSIWPTGNEHSSAERPIWM